ncbi:hypothetical protein E1A91_A09G031800v1 [Gossypium mustelinum]|uniref:Uncharacterized protein n=1 Tax=Gossypium mustelinum TaxID=34275 RepID=A0A5D2XSS1_GOSMU|nr:hypothetical protein E1A91_A09G031800v1 [Gossypium mustelinum]
MVAPATNGREQATLLMSTILKDPGHCWKTCTQSSFPFPASRT